MRRVLLGCAVVGVALVAGVGATLQPKENAMASAGAVQTGFLFKTITAGGTTLKYAVYVPRDYTPEKAWPAIVFLHGSGESGMDGQKMIIQGVGSNILWNAGKWPCIVMFPQKPVEKDQWEKYDGAVMGMLAETRKAYSVDADRISITGLSQGGHGVWSIGAAHPEVWCAAAAICGYADAHGGGMSPEQIAGKMKGVPMWIFHGEEDDVVPPEQSKRVAAAMKAAGGDVKLTLYPKTNHGSWDKAYNEGELAGFLMKGRKK